MLDDKGDNGEDLTGGYFDGMSKRIFVVFINSNCFLNLFSRRFS